MYFRRTSMTRCEQQKNEALPAAAGGLAAEGGVAKLEDFRNTSTPVFPVGRVAKIEEFRNDDAKKGVDVQVGGGLAECAASGGQKRDDDQLGRLPQPVLAAGRGRPKAVTPQIQEQLCLLLSVGLSRRQAAAYLGIDHTTVSHTAARDAEFSADLKRAEDVAAGRPMLSIFAESQRNWRAAAWLVEHRRLHPPALTPEEKAERHKESLEDARRQGEVACALSDSAWGRETPARRQAENAELLRRRKKKGSR
jgi:hypothetical protein